MECIIGTLAHERTTPQAVFVDLDLHADLAAAAASDDLADTVDYLALRDELAEAVAASAFQLIERLAGFIAERCLARPGVQAVGVRVGKPAALKDVRTVEVEIFRTRCEDKHE